MKRRLLLLCSISLVIILAALSIVGCKAPAPEEEVPPPPEAKTLQIGYNVCMTGGFAVRDVPDWNQLNIAVDLMNERGGITVNGQQYLVEIIPEDNKTTMDGVTAACNKLVFDEGVKFMIGPVAFFSAAAGPVTDPNKVMRVITWCCNSPGELDATTPYCFMGCNSSVAMALTAAKFFKQAYPDVKKIAIVTPDDGAAPYLIPIAEDILKAEGLTPVGDIVKYSNELIDMSPIAAMLNTITEADAIIQVNGVGPHVGGIIKGLRELGNYKPYSASLPTSLVEIAVIAGKENCEDVFTCALDANDPDMPPLAKEIIDRTVAQYGADYSLYLDAADCIWDLKYAIEAAQSLDPTVVKAKWESMNTIDTIFGPGTVCGEETYGIRHVVVHPQPVHILKDGVVQSGGWIDIGIIP